MSKAVTPALSGLDIFYAFGMSSLWKSASENDFFRVKHFFTNFDFKNRCKNALEGHNKNRSADPEI